MFNMSYYEFFDLFEKAQTKKCPFRAFTFDVIASRTQKEYIKNPEKHIKFANAVYKALLEEELKTGKIILLKDENNIPLEIFTSDINKRNPILLGDMVTYFVHEGSITQKRMIEIFVETMNKFNINYGFHYDSGAYETNDYAEGGSKLFKGYLPPILENKSKHNGIIINKYGYEEEKIF